MPQNITQGLLFFDSLPAQDSEAFITIENILKRESPLNEAEWLDYKDGDDKRIEEHWSKALSGFANSGGGVIIWGLKTEKQNGQDIPIALSLVENPPKLEGLLKTALSYAVDPPVIGVKTRSISNQDGQGIVVAYVPESGSKPHRSERGKPHYYIRVGHQFSPANTALLRILFYPRNAPKMEPVIFNVIETLNKKYQVHISVKNDSRITAYDPFMVFTVNNSVEFAYLHAMDELTIEKKENYRIESEIPWVSHVIGEVAIHPKMYSPACIITLDENSKIGVSIYGRDMEPSNWEIVPSNGDKKFVLVPALN